MLFPPLCACGASVDGAFLSAHEQGRRAERDGKLLDAARAYEQAAKVARKERDRDEARYQAARAYREAGQLDVALRLFLELAEQRPPGERSHRALYEAAQCKARSGDGEGARTLLRRLLDVAPEHGLARSALHQLADALAQERGEPAAIAFERELLPRAGSDSFDEELRYDLAGRLQRVGDERAALAGYVECARRHPYPQGSLWDDALWNASLLHERQGDWMAAVTVLEELLAKREGALFGSNRRPRMSMAQFRLGELARDRLADRKRARLEFHKVYVEHPTSLLRARALFAEGELARDSGDAQDACALAETLLSEFAASRYAHRADALCPRLQPRVAKLREAVEQRRSAGLHDD